MKRRSFIHDTRALSYLWLIFAVCIIFLPIMIWPLNTALIQVEENIGYTFSGSDALALTVVNVCTGYILFFCIIGCAYWVLIRSKAENSGMEY